MQVTLNHYDYIGGTRDGEWGVELHVDKNYVASFHDEAAALEYFIINYLEVPHNLEINREYSGVDKLASL